MDADGTRAAAGFGSTSVLQPPGRYTVRLTVNGQSFTQPLDVLKDPNVPAITDQDIRASTDALQTIANELNASADIVNTIETVRAQLQTLRTQLATDAANAGIRAGGDSLERKFMAVEGNLIDLRLTGRGQDGVRYPTKAAGQLGYVAGGISVSDFAPTAQQREVQQSLDKQVRDTRAALEALMARDLANFNTLLRSKGLKTIDATLPAVVF